MVTKSVHYVAVQCPNSALRVVTHGPTLVCHRSASCDPARRWEVGRWERYVLEPIRIRVVGCRVLEMDGSRAVENNGSNEVRLLTRRRAMRTGDRVPIPGGRNCDKCRHAMQRYKRPDGWEPRPGRGWYRFWDICENDRCLKSVQCYEHAKVQPTPALTLFSG